ncbi:RIC1-domain-containing protein [Papiliotrema laurentii]|uniref:RIC1-domain-containing protein n=1 Tax=Papiliotrema laurentii TaxID=5418 RepID=A0AAD9FPW1_PAPLA|nr:RIC1-domain-containing protein [Papiliotrema laurentii]
MYWPINAANILSPPYPLAGETITAMRPNRRGNMFVTLTKNGLGVWDVRPNVLQAAVVRTKESLDRWGENIDVFWSYDNRGIIILTSTSHLLVYQLVSTGQAVFTHPMPASFPPGVGAGEGDLLTGWTLKPLGAGFVMGGITTLLAQPHALMFGLRHPPSVLTVPWPIPTEYLTPAGSTFPPNPLDGTATGQEDIEQWEVSQGSDWISSSEGGSIPVHLSISRTQGLPTLHALRTADGRVYAMYRDQQLAKLNLSPSNPSTPNSRPSPSLLPPHQAPQSAYFPTHGQSSAPRYTGHLLHPLVKQSTEGLVDATEKLDLASDLDSRQTEARDAAVEVTVNGRFGLVAIGTNSGTVEIIAVPPYPASPRWSHTLDLKHSASLRTTPGQVQRMSWTTDGYALAVGYEHGWAVWSVGGRLGGWGMADSEESDVEKEGFMHGVKDLFWAPGNLELFALSSPTANNHQLYVIPFTKSATTSQHSPDNTRYAFLQMDDKVMVYRGADQPDMSVINPESAVWQNIKVPEAYIATNWPIRYASISSDGNLIAVAGRRGLTHYSNNSGRWKLFEDERQERDFVVRGGLLWFRHILIAGVDVDRSHQIRLYSRDADLADQHILFLQSMPAPILVMSLLDNSLLVYTADNTLYHFLIVASGQSVKLNACGSISFAGIVQVPSRVRALSWLVPRAQKELGDPADDLIVATIIFLVDGKLVLLRPRRAGNDEVRYDLQILADRIESYWTHLRGVGTLENSLWGFDGKGMRIWLDALTIEATQLDTAKDAYETVKESIYLALDFHPLSILMDKGIIIGVNHETSTRSLPFSLFKVSTGSHLFLPPFLRYHLSRRRVASALTFAANYSSLVYFAHSLEVLLHSVLEDEVESGVDLLPTVVNFLDHFPESLEVVVGCARKTEVDRWGVLFDVVGKPRGLFETCLREGMLKTAAGYLLVLQNLEELDNVKDTVRVLRLAMVAKEDKLCKEVLRFLQSIDDSGEAFRAALEDVGLSPSEAILSDDPEASEPSLVRHTPQPVANTSLTAASNTELPSSSLTSGPTSSAVSPTPPRTSSHTPLSLPSDFRADQRTPSPGSAQVEAIRNGQEGRVTSPFQLSSPRSWTSPPSPLTVETMPDQPTLPTPPAVPGTDNQLT